MVSFLLAGNNNVVCNPEYRRFAGGSRDVLEKLVALMHCIEDLSRANESIHRIKDSVQA